MIVDRDDVLDSPMAITSQIHRGTVHSLLHGGDGVCCAHESLHNAEVVIDYLDRRAKQLVVQGTLLTILRELSYFS